MSHSLGGRWDLMRDAIVKDDEMRDAIVKDDTMRDAIVKDLMRDAIVKNDNMRDAVVKNDEMRDAIVKDLMRDAIVKDDLKIQASGSYSCPTCKKNKGGSGSVTYNGGSFNKSWSGKNSSGSVSV